MEVVDVPEPDAAGQDELIVRPETVGLCGSDFHYFHGDIGLTDDPDELYPRIQGHEFSAIVEDVGPGCPPSFAAGQRVAVWPLSACGHCRCCRIGRENACENISLIGIHVDGALQELLRVPAHQAFPVALDDARLAAFVEPMSIAVRTVVRGRVEADEHVLVLGAGPIGHAVAIAALDRGAKVLLVDRVAERLELQQVRCRSRGLRRGRRPPGARSRLDGRRAARGRGRGNRGEGADAPGARPGRGGGARRRRRALGP